MSKKNLTVANIVVKADNFNEIKLKCTCRTKSDVHNSSCEQFTYGNADLLNYDELNKVFKKIYSYQFIKNLIEVKNE